MLTRRDVLQTAGLGTLYLRLPSVAFANAAGERRFVLLMLRGAVDGLALAAPYGDGNYRKARGELAMSITGDQSLLKIDGMFGIHPALAGVYAAFGRREALIVHAIASPYRERSHFDGQDVLESGAARVGALHDGWLNRALGQLAGSRRDAAIAMNQNTPLVLRGDHSVTSWAPSGLPGTDTTTLERLQDLYAGDEFFSTRLLQALNSQEIAGTMHGMELRRRGNDAEQLRVVMQATARFLTAPEGPQVAVVEAGGWDTHANQGAETGSLANRFSALDAGLAALRDGLGGSWHHAVIAVVTEFGRTVAVNGTRGTDHGTATAALLVGGAVDGGRVLTDWPGLGTNDLVDRRDLRPTADLRSLFKGLLREHLLLPDPFVDGVVFPDSAAAKPMRDLIRS